MLFINPVSCITKNSIEENKLQEERDSYSTLIDDMSFEIDMQRLRWEYKNMREKKRFIE
jgi:hypothetical protein